MTSQAFVDFCEEQGRYLLTQGDEITGIGMKQLAAGEYNQAQFAFGAAAAMYAMGRAFRDAVPTEDRPYDWSAADLYDIWEAS